MKQVENERIRKESQERNFTRSSFDVNMVNTDIVAGSVFMMLKMLKEIKFFFMFSCKVIARYYLEKFLPLS